MNRRNFISGIVVFLFFLIFFVMTGDLKASAAFWPKLICEVGMALSALNLVYSGLKMRQEAENVPVFPLNGAQTRRALILGAVAVVWILAIPRLGYILSSTLATAAVVLLFEPIRNGKRILIDVVVTVVFTVVMYKLFAALGVNFPLGLLKF